MSIHLFVVTNSTTDPAIIDGKKGTWDMLNALGRTDRMPDYTALLDFRTSNYQVVEKAEDIKPRDLPGLKTHICTLVSMDSPQGKRLRTYVHSKVMMIDDVFLIQGSANINLRSMAFDSEIAIALQDTDQGGVISAMRNYLWSLHTANKEGCSDNDIKKTFVAWGFLLDDNSKIWASPTGGDMKAPVIKFIDDSPAIKDND